MSATVLVGQAPINLGPLTTTFVPPPACTVAVGAGGGGLLGGLLGAPADNIAYLGQTCLRGKPIEATSCWPPTSSGAPSYSGSSSAWGFYSPGLFCPTGYATACSAIGGSGGESGWPVQFKLLDGETAVGCCPSGYGCANINGQVCTMVATSTTVPTVTCEGTKSGDLAFQTVPDAKASITAFSLFAPMIQINWQSSDKPQTTAIASSSASQTGTIAISTTASANSTKTTRTIQSPSISGTQSIDTGAASGVATLETAEPQSSTEAATSSIAATSTFDSESASTSSTSAEQKDAAQESAGIAMSTKVGLGITGGVVAAVALASALIFLWRRRKNQQEEQELDRLYGMKHSSDGELATHEEIPGWYRGQMPVTPRTPAVDPYRGGGASDLAPPSPYYRPYRP
ncbi:hypothetical protein B0T22DRAFT_39168 [Podospora appendiculata]|uniref:Uncharacterized protein n=1 Tax=Podospora appendiculata TaxID=314037 RepID=A0AAE1CG68_9PEZI|nr:hypothetical protein B0T22DRAFT_39168 [Podospora appendiculata]